MNLLSFLLPAVIVVLISLPLVNMFKGHLTKKSAKRRLVMHVSLFFALVAGCFLYTMTGASAADEVAGAVNMTGSIAQGCSALGAGIAVAAAAPAAIGAFSENEKNFGKSLIFVALGEGVAIYGLLISILIINQL